MTKLHVLNGLCLDSDLTLQQRQGVGVSIFLTEKND